MAVIITGTVAEWAKKDDQTYVKKSKDIPVYVANENTETSTVVPAIIAKYIVDQAKITAGGPDKDPDAAELKRLLEAAETGQLQVVGTPKRTVVTPPFTLQTISS